MCNHFRIGHRSPSIYCILPPHILVEIAKNGSPQQRSMALDTLSTDHTVRQFRSVQAAALSFTHAVPMPVAAAPSAKRSIYDAQSKEDLPGRAVRAEGAPASGDKSVDEAYDGLGATFEFYLEAYHRNSID